MFVVLVFCVCATLAAGQGNDAVPDLAELQRRLVNQLTDFGLASDLATRLVDNFLALGGENILTGVNGLQNSSDFIINKMAELQKGVTESGRRAVEAAKNQLNGGAGRSTEGGRPTLFDMKMQLVRNFMETSGYSLEMAMQVVNNFVARGGETMLRGANGLQNSMNYIMSNISELVKNFTDMAMSTALNMGTSMAQNALSTVDNMSGALRETAQNFMDGFKELFRGFGRLSGSSGSSRGSSRSRGDIGSSSGGGGRGYSGGIGMGPSDIGMGSLGIGISLDP